MAWAGVAAAGGGGDRAAAIARAGALAAAVALLAEPPVFFVALLFAPLLIEPVLYDYDRIGMALSGAPFAGLLAVLLVRAPDGPPAAARYLVTCALATGLPAELGWVAAFHRGTERTVAQPRFHGRAPGAGKPRVPGLCRHGEVGERRRGAQQDYPRAARHGRLCTDQRHRHDGRCEGACRRGAGVARRTEPVLGAPVMSNLTLDAGRAMAALPRARASETASPTW